jgi:protein-S-isoprenylcysteine O-methyltransferase Ste14
MSMSMSMSMSTGTGTDTDMTNVIARNHTLTREGPYKRIRHPMYTQIWIMIVAQLIITSNWFVGLVGIACWSILYFIRVPKEEKMMEETFGEAYLSEQQDRNRQDLPEAIRTASCLQTERIRL